MSRRHKNGYKTRYIGGQAEAYEHVLVAERALGRPLPAGAEVHHVNENKLDNAPSNLVICQDKAYHKLLHFRARIAASGGNPNIEKLCSTCKALKPFAAFNKASNRRSYGLQTQCRECQWAYQRTYKKRPA